MSKKFSFFMAAAVFVLAVSLGACFGEDVVGEDDGSPDPVTVIDDVNKVPGYLENAPGGGAGDPPVQLKVRIDLGWGALLKAIYEAEKYVALDLSDCTMSGSDDEGVFDPGTSETLDEESNAGKGYIVSLVLPDAATSIMAGNYYNPTFKDFSALKSVRGEKVGTVDTYAFYGCNSLETVSFPAATSIDLSAFDGCTSLVEVSFPAAIYIDTYAFYQCSSLVKVSLPKAESIGVNAFENCSSLTTVSLPEAENIGRYAFRGCFSLVEVSLPEATNIGQGAFTGCTGLTTVSLPAAMYIDYYAFENCSSLQAVSLPKAESIGSGAFQNCSNLVEVSLPEAENIGRYAFAGCTGLTTVSLPAAAPSTLGKDIFLDITTEKAVTVLVPAGTTTGYDDNWEDGFRGRGWDGSNFVEDGTINTKISLNFDTYQ